MKEDRGNLDLTKQLEDLQLKVETYEELIGDTKKLKWEVKKLESEIIKKDNLIEGMKQIITDLSDKK
jgi:chaperonin cofactor prefoldin